MVCGPRIGFRAYLSSLSDWSRRRRRTFLCLPPFSFLTSYSIMQVSESALDYLTIELVSTLLAKAAKGGSGSSEEAAALFEIEALGYKVGQRLAER